MKASGVMSVWVQVWCTTVIFAMRFMGRRAVFLQWCIGRFRDDLRSAAW